MERAKITMVDRYKQKSRATAITPVVDPKAMAGKRDMGQGQHITHWDRQAIMAETSKSLDAMPMVRITGTTIRMLNSDTLIKTSTLQVKKQLGNGQDYTDTPDDPLLGVLENNRICASCHGSNMDCPGHLGYMTLNVPLAHPLLLRYLVFVLTSHCNDCSGLLVTREFMEQRGLLSMSPEMRLKTLAEICASGNIRCTRYNREAKNKVDIPGTLTPSMRRPKAKACNQNPIYEMKNIKDGQIWVKYRGPKNQEILAMLPIASTRGDGNTVETILKFISDEDAKLLGFRESKPIDLLLRHLPIIPPAARPIVVHDGEVRPDLLTSAYNDIIKDNDNIRTAKPQNMPKMIQCLQFHVRHMMDNSSGRYIFSQNEEVYSIAQRIQKKEGVIRGAIMGKRQNHAARSVAGTSSKLRYGQIAVPRSFAKVLTIVEKVNSRNYKRINQLYKDGIITHVIPYTDELRGQRFRATEKFRNGYNDHPGYQLIIGDQVERPIQEGDRVIFGRQPSLHKQSLMGAEIVFWDNHTIGAHMCYTKPLNLDFDGDEISFYVLQDESAYEAATIASVKNCIMSGQTSKTVVGIVYNSLTSAYLLTQRDSFQFTEEEFHQGLAKVTLRDAIPTLKDRLQRHKVKPFTGRALFSAILPEDLWYEKGGVVIRDGVLIKGTVSKAHIGAGGNTILQTIWKWYGPNRASDFITDCVFILDWFIEFHGFSIGYFDCVVPPAGKVVTRVIKASALPSEQKAELDALVATGLATTETQERARKLAEKDRDLKLAIDVIIRKGPETNLVKEMVESEMALTQAKINALGDQTEDMSIVEREYREKQIQSLVNLTAGFGQRVGAKLLSEDNAINIMGRSGAKGDDTNTAQIVAALGQQYVKGERPAPSLRGERCSIYARPHSKRIQDRGFVTSSFFTGLELDELYYHSLGVRVGLLDTATKTAETGHMQHRMVKTLEGVVLQEDGSVRNPNRIIFQASYGDGFDPAQQVHVKSKTGGEVISFIDINEAVGRVNSKFGYY
jgi:DNA-directed RNA polymerase beta' subunit